MHDLGTMLAGYEILRQVTPDGISTTYEARARARSGWPARDDVDRLRHA